VLGCYCLFKALLSHACRATPQAKVSRCKLHPLAPEVYKIQA